MVARAVGNRCLVVASPEHPRLDEQDRTQTIEPMFPTVPGIVLAGGRSLRMSRVKALLPWPSSGEPFVVHVTRTLRDAGASPVAVVTGMHHDTIAAAVAAHDIPVLFNPRHAEGQLSSLQHGLAWAFARTDGLWALMTLVDVPGVSVATVRALLEAAATTSTALAVRPAIDGRHGHPVVWRRDVLPMLAAADPAVGARAVMHALAKDGLVADVRVEDRGVLVDVDTVQDYEEQVRRATRPTDVGSRADHEG